MSIEEKLKELGIELPEPAAPAGAYVPAVKEKDFVFTAGQIPLVKGELKYKGLLGQDLTTEEGQAAARTCAINCLAVLKNAVGDLKNVKQIIKVVVFVASAPGFTEQHLVANGASELFAAVLGDKGLHARSAVGMAALPLNAAVEVEVVARVKD